MFLRPTESPVVFLQQLGRGLRLYKGKEYLNVLDFIGNYEKAGKAQLLLSGEQSFSKKGSKRFIKIKRGLDEVEILIFICYSNAIFLR